MPTIAAPTMGRKILRRFMPRLSRGAGLLRRRVAPDPEGVERGAAPPLALGAEPEDREVQVRRLRRRVAGAAHVADHLALAHGVAFGEAVRIALQVRVVIGVARLRIELVDGESAGLA